MLFMKRQNQSCHVFVVYDSSWLSSPLLYCTVYGMSNIGQYHTLLKSDHYFAIWQVQTVGSSTYILFIKQCIILMFQVSNNNNVMLFVLLNSVGLKWMLWFSCCILYRMYVVNSLSRNILFLLLTKCCMNMFRTVCPHYTLFTTNDQKQLFGLKNKTWLVGWYLVYNWRPELQNFVHIIYLSRNITNLGHIGLQIMFVLLLSNQAKY